MTCREIAEFLVDYLSGDLPESTASAFEAHIRACRDCRNYLDGYRKTITASKAALAQPLEADAAPDMPEQLVQAILAARRCASDGTRS